MDPAKLQFLFFCFWNSENSFFKIHYSPLPLFHCEQEELGSALADWLHSMNSEERVFQQPKV